MSEESRAAFIARRNELMDEYHEVAREVGEDHPRSEAVNQALDQHLASGSVVDRMACVAHDFRNGR